MGADIKNPKVDLLLCFHSMVRFQAKFAPIISD